MSIILYTLTSYCYVFSVLSYVMFAEYKFRNMNRNFMLFRIDKNIFQIVAV